MLDNDQVLAEYLRPSTVITALQRIKDQVSKWYLFRSHSIRTRRRKRIYTHQTSQPTISRHIASIRHQTIPPSQPIGSAFPLTTTFTNHPPTDSTPAPSQSDPQKRTSTSPPPPYPPSTSQTPSDSCPASPAHPGTPPAPPHPSSHSSCRSPPGSPSTG